MNILKSTPSRIYRTGATLILMLIMLVVIIIFVAFAIDIGRVQLAQVKLQTSADFAARAGAEALSRGVGDVSDLAAFETAVRNETNMIMEKNALFGQSVTLDSQAEIQFAVSDVVANSGLPAGPGRGNGNGNGNGGGGNGGGNGAKHGNGKNKFAIQTTQNGGALTSDSNTVEVFPQISQFPLAFGGFVGRDSFALQANSAARVIERDIVIVLDRSTSMLTRDAGTIATSEYNANLRDVEEALYGPDDYFNLNPGKYQTEFVDVGGQLDLTRFQALKLAILKFRKVVGETTGNEQLGLVTYSDVASDPSQVTVPTPGSKVDIEAGLSGAEFAAIIDDAKTDATTGTEPVIFPSHEHTASELEDESSDYRDFDFNYLRTRWCGFTHIADGIIKGADALHGTGNRAIAKKVLIVMTDGKHNRTSTPETAATTVMGQYPNMEIYTITFGAGSDQTTMGTVATTGNGQHFHAANVDDLVEVFEELGANAGVQIIK